MNLYNKLHDAGVVHGDVSARHIFRHPKAPLQGHRSNFRLIDFEGAITRRNVLSSEEFKDRLLEEITKVSALTGLKPGPLSAP